MYANSAVSPHWSFWLIAVVALLYNAMDVMNYFMQMNPEALADYPEAARAIVQGRPAWATAGFAIAVFGGTIGGLLLLLRKSSASYLFIASLLGTLVTMIHTLRVGISSSDFGLFAMTMYVLMPIMVAAIFVWYAMLTQFKGWIR